MRTKERILLESKAWRQEKLNLDKNYFDRLTEMRNPKILWITSTDSLVSFQEITNTEPGDIIVYRNLGGQVNANDLSLLAVLEDAIEVCQVSHIIVCGYSHCTAIRDILLGTDDRPSVKAWLGDLRALYERNYEAMIELPFEKREKMLSELNVRAQVTNLSQIACIQKAWEKRDYPKIYGWYFALGSGTLQEVFSLEKNHRIKQLSSLTEGDVPQKITAS